MIYSSAKCYSFDAFFICVVFFIHFIILAVCVCCYSLIKRPRTWMKSVICWSGRERKCDSFFVSKILVNFFLLELVLVGLFSILFSSWVYSHKITDNVTSFFRCSCQTRESFCSTLEFVCNFEHEDSMLLFGHDWSNRSLK